jgi:hypothetical protein
MAKQQAGALVVRRYADRSVGEAAVYVSAPQHESREAPPAALYLGRLAPNTRGPARYRLERIADMLSGGRVSAVTFPWERVSYSDVMNLRVALEKQYPDSPGTRNNFLKNLRGVLRECWDAGYIEDKTFRRIMGILLFPVPGTASGRAVMWTWPRFGSCLTPSPKMTARSAGGMRPSWGRCSPGYAAAKWPP